MSVDRWRHQDLVFQRGGQALHYDPPEGRPSETPRVEVIRVVTGRREAATVGPCSVDAVRTTLAEAAAPGMTTLSLADGSGVARGRRYLLSNGEGDREWIEVHARDGARLTTRRPLLFWYPTTSSALIGCRISAAVDPAWAAERSKLTDELEPAEPELAGYRICWAYEVDGVALTGTSTMDLVRQAAIDLVTPMDVELRFPGWLERLPAAHREDQGADFILEAFTAVKLDARGSRHTLRCLRDRSVLRELVILRANLINVEQAVLFGRASSLEVTLAEQRYGARRDELLREPGEPSAPGALRRATGRRGGFRPMR